MLKKIVFCSAIFLLCLSHSLESIGHSGGHSGSEAVDHSLYRIEQEIANRSLSKASLADLISIVDKYPTNSHAHIVLGNCCDAMGLPEQAMEQYKLAVKYSPNNVNSLIELVKAEVRAGQLSAASSLLKQAMERFPTDPQILFCTGNALFKEQRYDQARELYVQALNKSKKPIVGINSALGNLSLLEQRYTNALSLAMADLDYNPNLPQANEVAGLALLRIGRFERARDHLAIAYKNNPANYNLAFNYAQTLIWCGKYNDALLPALSALANSANFIDRTRATKVVDNIAPYLSKPSILEAIEQVKRSDNLNKNIFVHLEIATICLKKGLPKAALNESLIAEKLDPHSSIAKYKLALVVENYKHDYPSALHYLRAARALDPYNYEIKQHLMRLEDRLTINKSDWAWRLKDWLSTKVTSSVPESTLNLQGRRRNLQRTGICSKYV